MKFKKFLFGLLVILLTFSTTSYAKFDEYPIIDSIEKYEFNRISDDDLKDFKVLKRYNKNSISFLEVWIDTFIHHTKDENIADLDDALNECDMLLENKVKQFEEKFGKDEFDRPYIIFRKSNKSPREAKPDLTKEKYEKIKKYANKLNFPSYEEYVKSWIDLNSMFSFKKDVIYQAVEFNHLSSGFIFKNNNLKYYNNGKFIKNQFARENGSLFYFDNDGNAVKNKWIKNNNLWYYFSSSFMAQKGWMLYNSQWYYFNEKGEMLEEKWIEYNSKWYYLKKDGAMAKNEKIGNYYVNKNGEWVK